jgi:glycerophosphoryl diester phosphodiesterase
MTGESSLIGRRTYQIRKRSRSAAARPKMYDSRPESASSEALQPVSCKYLIINSVGRSEFRTLCCFTNRVVPLNKSDPAPTFDFDLQGHRGARGLLPENTIPAFRRALELGVDTLELDVVVSADGQVVVSHDTVISTEICSNPDGTPVARELRLYGLTYAEIAGYDCGSRGNPRFPDQESSPARKPLLSAVIQMEREYSRELGRPRARWNIETKSLPSGDGVLHPGPEVFARALYRIMREGGILERAVVQSFDPRTLQATRALDPAQSLSLLVDLDRVGLLEENLAVLGFTPEVYSPHEEAVTSATVSAAHALGMLMVPWTVNAPSRMIELLKMGVDGIITDFPDRAVGLQD